MLVVTNQKVNDSIHEPRRVALARMDARTEYDRLSNGDVYRVGQEVGDYKHIDVVARQ